MNREEWVKDMKEKMKAYQAAHNELMYRIKDLQDMDRLIQKLKEELK